MKKHLKAVLIRPRITEKATAVSESSVYVFEIEPRATKAAVKKAFNDKYKVVPLKVTTVTIPQKKTFVRGKRGVKAGYKKAYIYVEKGQKVEIM